MVQLLRPEHSGLEISRVTVTPEVARKMLATRTERQAALVKPWKVRMFSRDFATKRWLEKGETIQFDYHGHLINGQHRLLALLEAGETFTFTVVRGLHPDIWRDLDVRLDMRNPSSVRRAEGLLPGGPLYDAAVRLVWLFDAGITFNAPKSGNARLMPTNQERAATEARHPEIQEAVRIVIGALNGTPLRCAAGAATLVAIKSTTSAPAGNYEVFVEALSDAKHGYRSREQAWILLRHLNNWKRLKKPMPPALVAHMMVKAWNYFVRDEIIHSLRSPDDVNAPLPIL